MHTKAVVCALALSLWFPFCAYGQGVVEPAVQSRQIPPGMPAADEVPPAEPDRYAPKALSTPTVSVDAADAGTNGDVFMTSPSPYTTSGVLVQSKPSWPDVSIKTGTSTSSSSLRVFNAADSELLRINSAGDVGIGTSSIGARLTLSDTSATGTRLLISGQEAYSTVYSSTEGLAFLLGVNRPSNRQLWLVDSAQTRATATAVRFLIGGTDAVIDAVTGNGAEARRLRIGNSGGVILAAGGNVGIGNMTAPLRRLDLENDIYGLSIEAANGSPTAGAIRFGDGTGWKFHIGRSRTAGVVNNGLTGAIVTVQDNGNVGIGTTAPTRALDVVGDAHFTGTVTGGNIKAKFQDLAEWVPMSEPVTPGTVVVLDPSVPNHVLASSRAYDTSVAGVVSAQPGIVLGEESDSKAMIATTGRVKVRVDATRGAVRIGDLLVSSDMPGTAMKSHPIDVGGVGIHRPGTVIGKALEPLESGVGEILVLLSLQ